MAASDQYFRLANEQGSLGLSCHVGGVSLAGVQLLQKTAKGFTPRPADEIHALMKCAYGAGTDPIRLTRGLDVVADALNRGDLGRAMIGAVHLRLDELSFDAATRIARADDALAKFDPNEPRDERGRWTTGGGSDAEGPGVGNAQWRPYPLSSAGQRPILAALPRPTRSDPGAGQEGSNASGSGSSWGGPVHLYGGQVTPVGQPPSNFPPEDIRPEDVPTREPDFNAPRVPLGFDTPGHMAGGLEYLVSRHPKLSNGKPWPVATYDVVKNTLAYRPGKTPQMTIFVPIDGIGDILVGSDADEDYERPQGYDEVKLIGTPQVTYSGPRETNHARDSIEEALRLAAYNTFSTIYFNRSYSTVTNRMVESTLRTDVVAVVRPGLNFSFRYYTYESLSPGQDRLDRQDQLPVDPSVRQLEAEHYERFMRAMAKQLYVFIGGIHVRDVRPLRP